MLSKYLCSLSCQHNAICVPLDAQSTARHCIEMFEWHDFNFWHSPKNYDVSHAEGKQQRRSIVGFASVRQLQLYQYHLHKSIAEPNLCIAANPLNRIYISLTDKSWELRKKKNGKQTLMAAWTNTSMWVVKTQLISNNSCEFLDVIQCGR